MVGLSCHLPGRAKDLSTPPRFMWLAVCVTEFFQALRNFRIPPRIGNSVRFWIITQRIVVIPYRRFGTNYCWVVKNTCACNYS